MGPCCKVYCLLKRFRIRSPGYDYFKAQALQPGHKCSYTTKSVTARAVGAEQTALHAANVARDFAPAPILNLFFVLHIVTLA